MEVNTGGGSEDIDELEEERKPDIIHLDELIDDSDEEDIKIDQDSSPPIPRSSIDDLLSIPTISIADGDNREESKSGLSIEISIKQTLPGGEVVQIAQCTNSDTGSFILTPHAMHSSFQYLQDQVRALHTDHQATYKAYQAARDGERWERSLKETYKRADAAKEKVMEEAVAEREEAEANTVEANRQKDQMAIELKQEREQKEEANARASQAIKEREEAVEGRKKAEDDRRQGFVDHADAINKYSRDLERCKEEIDQWKDAAEKAKEAIEEEKQSKEQAVLEERRLKEAVCDMHARLAADVSAGEKRKREENAEKDKLVEGLQREIKRLKGCSDGTSTAGGKTLEGEATGSDAISREEISVGK